MATSADPRQRAEAGLTGLAAAIVRSARDTVVHSVEVAALESRMAGIALATMAAIGLGVVVLVLSAWGLLVAAGVSALVQAGMGVASALLLAAFISLVAAGLLVLILRWLARRLAFPATRRVLQHMRANGETEKAYTAQGARSGAGAPGAPTEHH